MEGKVITVDMEPMVSILQSIKKSMRKTDRLTESYRPMLNGERYVTDRDVSVRLHISRRTMQEYRNAGLLPYMILGGKVLYRESDIQRLLDGNYRKAFRS